MLKGYQGYYYGVLIPLWCRSDALMKGIRTMGFVRPSKIQERALPLMVHDP